MQGISLEPSHVKQLLTTAPRDMKAAKERRTKGRAAAKERKKTKSRSLHGDVGTYQHRDLFYHGRSVLPPALEIKHHIISKIEV